MADAYCTSDLQYSYSRIYWHCFFDGTYRMAYLASSAAKRLLEGLSSTVIEVDV
jgi:hypothetical protein